MPTTSYLSTIHPAWSLERQRAAIGADGGTEYVDEVSTAARKRRDPAVLKARADLLRPSSRQTASKICICVASPSCLAFSPDDLSATLAAAADRHATVRFADTGIEIAPRPETMLVDTVARQFSVALRRRGLHRPHAEIAEERRKDTLRRIDLIRADWPKPEPSTAELLARAGVKSGKPMAPATAREHLGPRPAAQRAYQLERNREAGRAAARARKQEAAKV